MLRDALFRWCAGVLDLYRYIVFTLSLFGGASLEGPEGLLTGRVVQRRRLAVLIVLALAHRRGVSRDKLVANLWPDSEPDRARHLLSDSLYVLRKNLGDDAVIATGDELRLNAEVVRTDVIEFEQALEHGEAERAITLYTGPLLDGVYLSDNAEWEYWVDGERERLSRLYGRALESLATERDTRGDFPGSVDAWRKAAAHEPTNSRVALHLMQALDAAGNRAAAIHHAHIHQTTLREQLGAEPDAAVNDLAEQLRLAPGSKEPPPGKAASQTTALQAGEPSAEPNTGGSNLPKILATKQAPGIRRPSLLGKRGAALLVVGVAVLASIAVWAALQLRTHSVNPSNYDSIAVLPFLDMSPDGGTEYLSDGMTEELINALAQVNGLRVASRTSAFALKGTNQDVREIGQKLNVDAVLEGSVRSAGSQLRVSAQLVSTENGYHLWSRTYQREMRDVFAIQEEIARAIVNTIRGRLAHEQSAPLVQSHTNDLEAYQLYLRGRFFWNQRDNSQRREETLRSAINYFQAALQRDPNYALAYSGLADAYASVPPGISRDVAYARAKTAALRALELDETLAEAHTALARILVVQEWDWQRAGREYQRAIELNPGYATAHQWYGMYLISLGRLDEALMELNTAQQLDPLSLAVNNDLGRALYYARRYDEAIEQYRKIIQLYPSSADAHLNLALTYAEKSVLESAIRELRTWANLSGDEPQALLGYTYAAAGRRDEALRILGELEERAKTARVSPVGMAVIHARLGNHDRAFALLEQAVQERSPFVLFLKVHPRLDPLRSDPRFTQLLRQVGLE
ncbi:MAG: tetratricopeptide repeat protein [Gemmatimonadota bacterium]|nr:tetratricopeptide repeat protein [Gemmatimonadota bacterium]